MVSLKTKKKEKKKKINIRRVLLIEGTYRLVKPLSVFPKRRFPFKIAVA
jgi:hypothetical protein